MIISLFILFPFLMIILLLVCGRKGILFPVAAGTVVLLILAFLLYSRVRNEGIQVTYAGGWKAPIGITLVADQFSAALLLLTAIVSLCIGLFAFHGIGGKHERQRFFVFFYGMIMGVNGVFVAGDIFNLYVWFEVTLMASFVLMVLGNGRRQLEGGLKYLTVNLIASMFFLAGIGLLYGETGTLNMAHLSVILRESELRRAITAPLGFLLVALGIKAAIVPFSFWLPTSYHTPPAVISAFFSGLLTKVGIYALIRIVTLFFSVYDAFWHELLLVLAGATMLAGAFAAFSQNDLRRILSFSIISQMGYLVAGLGIFTTPALAATLYLIAHNVLVKTGLFLLTGIMGHVDGDVRIDRMKGWQNRYPLVAFLFFLLLMALGGIPPLSGFFGKFLLATAGFTKNFYWISGILLFTGLLTLGYMLRVWTLVFWKEPEHKTPKKKKIPLSMLLPVIILTGCALALGFGAGLVYDMVNSAARELLNPAAYLEKVLQGYYP